tara:strand:+ start:978 stop:1577 length:600 start_codon:yes stop_codon:yes gene_type:complete
MERTKKIKLIQFSLIIIGSFIIFFTYYLNKKNQKNQIINKETQQEILKAADSISKGDIFYNIEYSGLDLAGNRYILKSEEATNNKTSKEIVNMKSVEAIFYFKNDKVLKVISDSGIYNNNSLDMVFLGNIKANYEDSLLFAEKAEYINSSSFLTISHKVKIDDEKGTMYADKILFDIKNQTVDISTFEENKINANIKLK